MIVNIPTNIYYKDPITNNGPCEIQPYLELMILKPMKLSQIKLNKFFRIEQEIAIEEINLLKISQNKKVL